MNTGIYNGSPERSSSKAIEHFPVEQARMDRSVAALLSIAPPPTDRWAGMLSLARARSAQQESCRNLIDKSTHH